jgi:hypothetical protein
VMFNKPRLSALRASTNQGPLQRINPGRSWAVLQSDTGTGAPSTSPHR